MNYKLTKKSEVQNYASFKRINSLILFIVIALALSNLIATNILATQGVKLNYLSQETFKLSTENQNLENNLSTLKSLSRIETLGTDKGFVRLSHTATISTSDVVAQVVR